MTFLWESIAFGPITSRRLGSSLGINLLPTTEKICSFDCLYCECGWTLSKDINSTNFYSVTDVLAAIEHKLQSCHQENIHIDSITFSGNGEPTIHPHFAEIIDGLLRLRDHYYPQSVITCLTNSTQLFRPDVISALQKIDNPILKLDAGNEEMLKLINHPIISISISEIVNNLLAFKGKAIIQTLFFSGTVDGVPFDNSEEPNFSQWLSYVKKIEPKKVMLYSLDRDTPAQSLRKFSKEKLEIIAEKVRKSGFTTEVY